MLDFLAGALVMGYAVAALNFVKFWHSSHERLFLWFAAGFVLLAVCQATISLSHILVEERSWVYFIRLAAFGVIITGIFARRLRRRQRPLQPGPDQ